MTGDVTEHPDYGILLRLPVHFGDLDAMGQLHNARYVNLVEQASEEVLARIGLRYQDGKVTHPDLYAAVREFHISYLAPIRATGDVAVHLWLDSLGNSSVKWGFQVLSVDSRLVHARGHRVLVKMDHRTGQSASWTDEIRSAIAPLIRQQADDSAILVEFQKSAYTSDLL
jgi:acyl-CoA thioester hydrolase